MVNPQKHRNNNWEKKWTLIGRLRTFKWVKTDQLADEFSDEEDQNIEDPGTPGIEEVDETLTQDFNQIEADPETIELERQLESDEARERQEAQQDNLIEQAAAQGSNDSLDASNSMDLS